MPLTPSHTIVLIRHAEIPGTQPPFGIDADGVRDEFGLVPRGWQRAGALARLFAPNGSEPSGVAAPTRLIAPAFGDPDAAKARRMHATLSGTAALLELEVQTPWGEGEEQALASEITAETDGVTLVCWGHTFIPTLARLIAPGAATEIPGRWPDERFDLIWTFRADVNTGHYRFGQMPQQLLAGDSETLIAAAA